MDLLSILIGIPEIMVWLRVGRLQNRTPTKSERHGNHQAPCPDSDMVTKYLIEQVHKTAHHLQLATIRIESAGFGDVLKFFAGHFTPATLKRGISRALLQVSGALF